MLSPAAWPYPFPIIHKYRSWTRLGGFCPGRLPAPPDLVLFRLPLPSSASTLHPFSQSAILSLIFPACPAGGDILRTDALLLYLIGSTFLRSGKDISAQISDLASSWSSPCGRISSSKPHPGFPGHEHHYPSAPGPACPALALDAADLRRTGS